jgi:hypothetical protein
MSKEMMICPKAKKNCASGIKCHEEEPHLYQPKFCNPNPCGYKCIPYIPEQEYECIIPSTMSRSCLFPHSSCSDKCKYWQPKKPVEPTCPERGQLLHTDWKQFAHNYLQDTLLDPRLELGLAICKKCGCTTPTDLQPDKNTCIHTPPCDFDAGGRPSPCKGK